MRQFPPLVSFLVLFVFNFLFFWSCKPVYVVMSYFLGFRSFRFEVSVPFRFHSRLFTLAPYACYVPCTNTESSEASEPSRSWSPKNRPISCATRKGVPRLRLPSST